MFHEKAKALLQEKNIRPSTARVELLSFFMHHPTGHSLTAIQCCFSNTFDRVTIYRTLNTFVDFGFITRTRSTSGNAYYIFHHHPSKIHPHLKCKCCEAIHCLPELPEQYLAQLQSFQIEAISILLEGVCEDCTNGGK